MRVYACRDSLAIISNAISFGVLHKENDKVHLPAGFVSERHKNLAGIVELHKGSKL